MCKASTHQGDPATFNLNSVGRQCLANCLIACVMASFQELTTWTLATMDYVLQEGDKLYRNINVEHDFLLPSDLPTCLHISNRIIHVVRGKEAFGSFVNNLIKTKKILSVLCTFIQMTQTSALLCLGDNTGSSAVTLLSRNSSIYVFDTHSRDDSGMPSANGTAVLMQFADIQSTVSFICTLAQKLSARLFHWTFWHSIPVQSVTVIHL